MDVGGVGGVEHDVQVVVETALRCVCEDWFGGVIVRHVKRKFNYKSVSYNCSASSGKALNKSATKP